MACFWTDYTLVQEVCDEPSPPTVYMFGIESSNGYAEIGRVNCDDAGGEGTGELRIANFQYLQPISGDVTPFPFCDPTGVIGETFPEVFTRVAQGWDYSVVVWDAIERKFSIPNVMGQTAMLVPKNSDDDDVFVGWLEADIYDSGSDWPEWAIGTIAIAFSWT